MGAWGDPALGRLKCTWFALEGLGGGFWFFLKKIRGFQSFLLSVRERGGRATRLRRRKEEEGDAASAARAFRKLLSSGTAAAHSCHCAFFGGFFTLFFRFLPFLTFFSLFCVCVKEADEGRRIFTPPPPNKARKNPPFLPSSSRRGSPAPTFFGGVFTSGFGATIQNLQHFLVTISPLGGGGGGRAPKSGGSQEFGIILVFVFPLPLLDKIIMKKSAIFPVFYRIDPKHTPHPPHIHPRAELYVQVYIRTRQPPPAPRPDSLPNCKKPLNSPQNPFFPPAPPPPPAPPAPAVPF